MQYPKYNIKKTRHLILAMGIFLGLGLLSVACENKRDGANKLAGNWQMLLWITPKGDTLATNYSGIYYSFQLKLLKIERMGHSPAHLARYRHTPDSLIITQVYQRPNDSLVSISALKENGVPENGAFHIDHLSHKYLQLSSTESGILRLRKY